MSARAHRTRAAVLASSGRHSEATDEYRAALAVFRDVDDRDSEAIALTGIDEAHAALGRLDQT